VRSPIDLRHRTACIDRIAAAATGGPAEWTDRPLGTYQAATFAGLADVRHHWPVVILDIRRNLEYATSHIEGATHIPNHDLLRQMSDVPNGQVWIHCASGYRASIAASVLLAHGRRVVAIDDLYDNVFATDLPMVETESVAR
jgi:hydroxyacylglutathione hydrolase